MALRGSLQQLRRAAFSLSGMASTSAAGGSAPAAACLPTLQSLAGELQGAAMRAMSPLAWRALHTASPAAAAAADASSAAPALNPLQQAPPPALDGAGGAGDLAAADGDASLSRATARGLSISPRKLNMFAKLIRGLAVQDAVIQCDMSPKKSAAICKKVLLSARANALNNHGLDDARLRVGQWRQWQWRSWRQPGSGVWPPASGAGKKDGGLQWLAGSKPPGRLLSPR